MYIDFKCTIWRRIHMNKEQDGCLEKIRKGEIQTINNIYETYPEENFSSETLYDTEEEMSVFANGGAPTIEVFLEDYTTHCVWDNGRNPEEKV